VAPPGLTVRRALRLLPLLLAAVGVVLLVNAAYIPAKAALAQWLLQRSWAERGAEGGGSAPWPGADLAPVARLRQPRLGVDQLVLDDASGRTLAFGPGRVSGSVRPGARGNLVLSGHRDTHFRWLRELAPGDELSLEADDGRLLRYRVTEGRVVGADRVDLLDPTGFDGLRLLTCYPFDAIVPGTPLRYLVSARPVPP
jgi:sortase A